MQAAPGWEAAQDFPVLHREVHMPKEVRPSAGWGMETGEMEPARSQMVLPALEMEPALPEMVGPAMERQIVGWRLPVPRQAERATMAAPLSPAPAAMETAHLREVPPAEASLTVRHPAELVHLVPDKREDLRSSAITSRRKKIAVLPRTADAARIA